MSEVKGVLVLEDGTEFEGFLFGAPVTVESIAAQITRCAPAGAQLSKDRGYGEAVFNTSLTGYQEILTDPSYYGQIVCMTVPHIGNTGVNGEDPESAHPWCAGFVIHEKSRSPSNWRSSGALEAYMIEHGIPGLYGVDTRALTLHLRTLGVARGVILPATGRVEAKKLLAQLPSFEGRDLIGEVTTKKPYHWTQPKQKPLYKVVTMDFGVKWNLLRSMERIGCEIEVVPATTSAADILARQPDGIFLSNGPGDPAAAPYAAKTVRELIGKKPLFGVCMGHQVLALAVGAKTYKLKFGHRGGNQPVIDRESGHVEISSHNHGYAVDAQSLPANAEVTHLNLNDQTCEGLKLRDKDAFSVQYHPEACPGPHDSHHLFDRFIEMMKRSRTAGKAG